MAQKKDSKKKSKKDDGKKDSAKKGFCKRKMIPNRLSLTPRTAVTAWSV